MTSIPDNELRTMCFNDLIDRVGYLDTERFVAMVSRSSEDYTSWHCRHFNDGLSARDLGEKVKAFAARKRLSQTVA